MNSRPASLTIQEYTEIICQQLARYSCCHTPHIPAATVLNIEIMYQLPDDGWVKRLRVLMKLELLAHSGGCMSCGQTNGPCITLTRAKATLP